jgi:hypothetical protein
MSQRSTAEATGSAGCFLQLGKESQRFVDERFPILQQKVIIGVEEEERVAPTLDGAVFDSLQRCSE